MLYFKQLRILLWKCWIMRRRHYISSLFELLIPLVLSIAIASLYANQQSSKGFGGSEVEQQSSYEPAKTFSYPQITFTYGCPLSFGTNEFRATIYYAPENDLTNSLMEQIQQFCNGVYSKPFKTVEEMNIRLNLLEGNDSLFITNVIGVSFDNEKFDKIPTDFKYTIRVFGYMAKVVNRLFPNKYMPGPAPESVYIDKFSPLQILINEAYLTKLLEENQITRTLKPDKITVMRMPYPSYLNVIDKGFQFSMQDVAAFTIVIGTVILCPLIVKRIADEKVAKAKEMLKMMGMSDWVFWSSHFLNYLTVMTFHSIIFVICFCVGFGGDSIINHSDPSLVFVILMIFNCQAILFCMLIATIINRPVIAVVFTVIGWIVSYSVPMSLLSPMIKRNIDVIGTNPSRGWTSLLPNMGLAWCFSQINQYENYASGLKWSNLYEHTNLYGGLTTGIILAIMICACIVYGILIWYLDAIWPWQYGVPKPFYFLFQPSYWIKSSKDKSDFINDINETDKKNFEQEPKISVGISIRHLRKVFKEFGKAEKIAVDDVSMNIFKGQITVLLGHNGAGKTTTMNMITGIFPPTSGQVLVDGYDIKTQTQKARQSLALCPQVNIIQDVCYYLLIFYYNIGKYSL